MNAPLALTMGEPAGVGTEITLKAYRHLVNQPSRGLPTFCLIDDPARVEKVARSIGVDVRVATIEHPGDVAATFTSALPVLPLRQVDLSPLIHVEPGKPSRATANVVQSSISQAVELALQGEVGGIVTNPVQKSVLSSSRWGNAGHTEYLGMLTAETPMPRGFARGPVMMLAAGSFRVVPVTVHVPLSTVADRLAADDIVRTGIIVDQSLKRDFGIAAPRLAVAGLNPHAGEQGTMGNEETEIIEPAIAALRERGVDAIGPLPADTMFHERARQAYSAALAMYHDQALIPIKTLAFDEAVNVTLGLPIVRTSPDHGTALDIAGTGRASPRSLIAALFMAAQTANARAAFAA